MSYCGCKGQMHSRFIHFWQRMTARGLSITVIYFHGDDERESQRELWLEVPNWIWRPRCWLKGHDPSYNECVYCGKEMN